MKTFITFLTILFTISASAQYTAVTHTTGTATYGAHTVTVTPAGSSSSIAWCGASPYWIGSGSGSTPIPGSYTFTFSPAVNAFRVFVTAANTGESVSVGVNGSHYSLTTANVFAYTGTCSSAAMLLSGDTILTPTVAGSPGAAIGIDVLQCGLTSATIATNGLQNGLVFTFMFSDTMGCSIASNNGPLCLGDTLKLSAVGTSSDTYAWSGPGGFSSTAQNPIKLNVSYADTGTFRLIKNGGDTAYTRFVIKPNPIINASSNSPICAGDNLLFTSGPDSTGETYSWTGPNGFTSTLQNPFINSAGLIDSGTYVVVATWNGCKDTAATLVSIHHVPVPVAMNNSPLCDGSKLLLTATDTSTTVTYSWAGPGGFSSTAQNPIINPANLGHTGTYTVSVSELGCVVSAVTVVTVNPVPVISDIKGVDPTPCDHADGTITLAGLTSGISYDVNYLFNGTPQAITIIADASGQVVITGLKAGLFDNFNVTSLGCTSNTVGPVTLKDPGIPKIPQIISNSPVCTGRIISLYAKDSTPGLTYTWSGPSVSVISQHVLVYDVTFADAGSYTVTVSNGQCSNSATTDVTIIPGVTLNSVTDSQSISYGGSVQLNALGAFVYLWTPHDGSLDNPNINNPTATPRTPTTYTVVGMNNAGCKDTATVFVDITFPDTVHIPTAFTPNADGINDIFRIVNPRDYKLVEFSVFNRWGETVYSNKYNITQGWDGTYNGVMQDMATYNYLIILATPRGENKVFKGSVTLIK